MNNNLKLLAIKYLTPLVYACAFYFLILLPRDGGFVSILTFLGGFYLANLLLWADGALLYRHYNELQTEPKQLITRSAVFLLAYVALGLFVITSTAAYIGHGLIFGLGVSLSAELLMQLRNPAIFQQRFLFQLERQLSVREMTQLTYGFVAAVGVLTMLFFV